MPQKNNFRKILISLTVLIVSFSISYVAFAQWQEPTASPPLNNVAAPINVSNNPQTFVGNKELTMGIGSNIILLRGGLNAGGIISNLQTTLARQSGNVIVGDNTDNPSARLQVAGQIQIHEGNPGNIIARTGQVLTSDAFGLATWQTLPPGTGGGIGGSGSVNRIPKFTPDATTLGDSVIYESSGNIGIGQDPPIVGNPKLHVQGNISFPNTATIVIAGRTGADGQVLTRTAAGMDWLPSTGGGGLPGGNINETLRHNGTAWASNPMLKIGSGTDAGGQGVSVGYSTSPLNNIALNVRGLNGADQAMRVSNGRIEIVNTTDDNFLTFNRGSSSASFRVGGTDKALVIQNDNQDIITIKNGGVGLRHWDPQAILDIRAATSLSSNPRVANVGGIYVQSDNINISPAIVLSAKGIYDTPMGGAIYMGQARQPNHGAQFAAIGDGVIGVTRPSDAGGPGKLILATGSAGGTEIQRARLTIAAIESTGEGSTLEEARTGIGINSVNPEATLDIRHARALSGNPKVSNVGGIYVETSDPDTSAAIVLSSRGSQSFGSAYFGHVRTAGANHGFSGSQIGDAVIGARGGTDPASGNGGKIVFATGNPRINGGLTTQKPKLAITAYNNATNNDPKDNVILGTGTGLVLRATNGTTCVRITADPTIPTTNLRVEPVACGAVGY